MRFLILNKFRFCQRQRQGLRLLRLILLRALSDRVQSIYLARHGEDVEFCFRHDDRIEQLIPPPIHLLDDLVTEIRRLTSCRKRFADIWERWRGYKVLMEREGTVRLLVGKSSALMRFWVLPYNEGTLLELRLLFEPSAASSAAEIMKIAYENDSLREAA